MSNMRGYMVLVEATEFLGVSQNPLRRWDRIRKLKASRHPAHGCGVSVCGRSGRRTAFNQDEV